MGPPCISNIDAILIFDLQGGLMLPWVRTALLKIRLILHTVRLASLSILCPGMFILVLLLLPTQKIRSGNCQLGLYCDSGTKLCMTSKVLGAACGADKEYASSAMSTVKRVLTTTMT